MGETWNKGGEGQRVRARAGASKEGFARHAVKVMREIARRLTKVAKVVRGGG